MTCDCMTVIANAMNAQSLTPRPTVQCAGGNGSDCMYIYARRCPDALRHLCEVYAVCIVIRNATVVRHNNYNNCTGQVVDCCIAFDVHMSSLCKTTTTGTVDKTPERSDVSYMCTQSKGVHEFAPTLGRCSYTSRVHGNKTLAFYTYIWNACAAFCVAGMHTSLDYSSCSLAAPTAHLSANAVLSTPLA
jgi:hypothetical protein